MLFAWPNAFTSLPHLAFEESAVASERSRRDFLRKGAVATSGLIAAGAAAGAQPHQGHAPGHLSQHQHGAYPRDHAGPGGPAGSATDPGKVVPGPRSPREP